MSTDGKNVDRKQPSPSATSSPAASGTPPRSRGMDKWQDLISEQLEQAQSQGAFDNLPGAGQPLNLNENPNEPSDMRMANKILKDNNLTPVWIGDRKKLQADIEQLRADMRREWSWLQAQLETVGEDRSLLENTWQAKLAGWEERTADLNRRIRELNISLPVPNMELLQLRLDEELTRMGASRAL